MSAIDILSLLIIFSAISVIVGMIIGLFIWSKALRKAVKEASDYETLYREYRLHASLLEEAKDSLEIKRNADIARAVELEKDNISLRADKQRMLDLISRQQISIERQTKRAIDAELSLSRCKQSRTANGRFAGKK